MEPILTDLLQLTFGIMGDRMFLQMEQINLILFLSLFFLILRSLFKLSQTHIPLVTIMPRRNGSPPFFMLIS